MPEVFPGRYTARTPNDATALFLIGMRVNTLRALPKARVVASAMPRMLRHLFQHPESGLLSVHSWLGRTTILLSYWRSTADVQRFASDPDAPHAEAWRRYVREIGSSGAVGVWHELYTVRPGDYEAVYANMPAFGLAAAGEHLPVGAGNRTSAQRMAGGAGGAGGR
ncbi:DUF4188 domain-containing protein [Nakamurella endophytica]|uniref:Transcriptional regulator n=1 Tax=Nakamurella endophytica TaxID=1748367 RepID=A0A917WFG5_9ACTN|nr:DUF4188 domain-containing protein [Nakamurella endophytica]GGL98799.1 transcriptional regulator [Nakamurella endophytica]